MQRHSEPDKTLSRLPSSPRARGKGGKTVLWNALCACLIAGTAIVSVAQVTRSSTRGYQMRDLETHIQDLTLENQRLEVLASEAGAMDAVATKTRMLGLVKTETPAYAGRTGGSVVSFNH